MAADMTTRLAMSFLDAETMQGLHRPPLGRRCHKAGVRLVYMHCDVLQGVLVKVAVLTGGFIHTKAKDVKDRSFQGPQSHSIWLRGVERGTQNSGGCAGVTSLAGGFSLGSRAPWIRLGFSRESYLR